MTVKMESCGCKGVRSCALCEDTERVKKLRTEEDKYKDYKCFVYKFDRQKPVECPALCSTSSLEEIKKEAEEVSSNDLCSLDIPGLLLILDFISESEEVYLMEVINKVEWVQSQSGRRKQDYGPKVNFKHKKVKTDTFVGMPEYADMLLEKMSKYSVENPLYTLANDRILPELSKYQPIEMCNLEYEESKRSAIEMHQDDMWIWGNRLISINLLSGAVMTLVNETTKQLCYVWMPHRSLLCMADSCRYDWKHGVNWQHIRGRRIALTMREASAEFQEGGALYEKFGKELVRLSNIRVSPSSR